MKIPYMKELMLVCIGLNISHFSISMVAGSTHGMLLAGACAALCGFSVWFETQREKGE